MHPTSSDAEPAPPNSRSPTGRGRPFPAEAVAAVRALVEGTALRFDEIAARTGVGAATVGRWSRRHGWRRTKDGAPPARPGPLPYRRYDEGAREAARALLEGSSASFERIGLELGIATATLFRWARRYRWSRPAPPDRIGPTHFRYRTRRGRPYAADAVGGARTRVLTTTLSQASIARQVGVSQATISNWIRRRGWERPPIWVGDGDYPAARRTAPTVESGSRRGRPYAPETVAAAREFWEANLPTVLIAARLRVSAPTIVRWANRGRWLRPRDLPDSRGRIRTRRGRRWAAGA